MGAAAGKEDQPYEARSDPPGVVQGRGRLRPSRVESSVPSPRLPVGGDRKKIHWPNRLPDEADSGDEGESSGKVRFNEEIRTELIRDGEEEEEEVVSELEATLNSLGVMPGSNTRSMEKERRPQTRRTSRTRTIRRDSRQILPQGLPLQRRLSTQQPSDRKGSLDLDPFSPPIAMESESVHRGLSYVDFIPERVEEGGFFSMPKYETFSVLMERGNDWLARNPSWETVTCESMEFKTTDRVQSERMTYYEPGERRTAYVRCLRLWLRRRKDSNAAPQQLHYVNCVPDLMDEKMFGGPKFQPLNSMIDKMNEMLQKNPLPGKIITIETQEMKVGTYSGRLDPDRSYWIEHGDAQRLFVFVIRIFFEVGSTEPGIGDRQEIGLADFSPLCEGSGGMFSHPKFEQFSSLVERMTAWCQSQSSIRISNVQSLEYKLKSGQLDTQRTSYTEHGNATTYYVRILRVAYVRAGEARLHPYIVTCRTFSPAQLDRGGMFAVPEYESMSQTRDRIAAWVGVTGARLISAETSAIRMFTGGEREMGPEATYTFNRGDANEYWIYIIRLYLDGEYKEPPQELLPPIPQIQEDSCCNIL
ncbi:unnamed protein product [Darwinula stevensoni]|uniref:Uncharacterized protein n=1 Tax=Darwinula stevensoni TaxID=69355 RepID=A0A7R8WZE8_9CRUS|nr:unnamed protein product [Darwinula stevensoni]CAG0880495.1 unnamed protein product [Darwinula stevensoni]